jgi:hypothetical protein
MALNTKHTYANRFYAHLTAGISSSATILSFYPEEITNLLAGWQASSWLYLCIMNTAGNLEIVKMIGLSGSTLTVERGQGGTTARSWAVGSLVACRAVAEYLARYIQKGAYRSGAFNPNGTLTGNYTGEKFYQTGPALEQRRWWINTTGSRWRLLTGRPYTGEVLDEWGFWSYIPNWVNYSDPSYWTIEQGSGGLTWDEENQWWTTGLNCVASMRPLGGWEVGKRWVDFYIMVMDNGFSLGFSIQDTGDNQLDVDNWGVPTYVSEEVRTLTWGALDFGRIYFDNRTWQAKFRVYINEGAPYDPDWVTTTVLDNTFWTPVTGSWNGTSWDMVWNGSQYELRLNAIGGWPAGKIFNRFRITGITSEGDYFDEVYFWDSLLTQIALEGSSGNPITGTFVNVGDIATLQIYGNWHGGDPGGTWQITNIELLTEDIYG